MGNFDGWTAVSKDQLVVWSGINKAYLLTITGYCPDLQFANAIAVTSTGNTVDKFEKVIVGRDRCFIKEIRPLDMKQMKEDRKLHARTDEERKLQSVLMPSGMESRRRPTPGGFSLSDRGRAAAMQHHHQADPAHHPHQRAQSPRRPTCRRHVDHAGDQENPARP